MPRGRRDTNRLMRRRSRAGWPAGAPGTSEARDRLFAVVHPQLRALAARLLQRERRDHTLEPNAVVNELYLRLIGGSARLVPGSRPLLRDRRADDAADPDRSRSRACRREARWSAAACRVVRGGWLAAAATSSEQLLDLDTLLSALATADPRAARVVELRFFGGLREEDVAEVLQVSVITVKRDWKAARAWLAAHAAVVDRGRPRRGAA